MRQSSDNLLSIDHYFALLKKCPYSELFRSAFFPHFPPAFGLNPERYFVSLCIQFKCVKNADQNNSEYGHSLRSVTFLCASLIIVTVRQGMQALSVDHSVQLPSSISLCIISKGLICIVIFYFFVCFMSCFSELQQQYSLFLFRDSNMISVSTNIRYYVVIIILVNLVKPQAIGN